MKHHILSIAFATLCLSSPLSNASPSYWTSGTGHNGHGYEVVVASGGISWSQAEQDAVARGGHLASITFAEEGAFVYSLASANSSFWISESTTGNGIGPWIGGLQAPGSSEPAGGWGWVDGEPFGYTNWASWEPSNGVNSPGNAGLGIEDRIHLFGVGSLMGMTWNDLPDAPSSPQIMPVAYVVETAAVPEPGSCVLMAIGLGMLGLMAPRRTNMNHV